MFAAFVSSAQRGACSHCLGDVHPTSIPAVVRPGCLHTKVTPSGCQASLGTAQLFWEALGQVGHPGQPWLVVPLSQTQAVSREEVEGSGTGAPAAPGLGKGGQNTQENISPAVAASPNEEQDFAQA